jgi:hypothetical protein
MGSLAAHGAVVPDLYAVEVPLIATDEDDGRESAYALALARVLVRVTGRRDIARDPDAAILLEQAERFVQQYTSRREDALWVAFYGPSLERAASQAGLPVWNHDRPLILVWLAVDPGDGSRALVGADAGQPVREQVEQAASARGLPIIWPLLDSTDRSAATVADVWGGFGDKIAAASARYRADAVLVGRLRGRPGQRLFGTWDLQTGADTQRWRGGVEQGIDEVADFLVARLATTARMSSTASLTVSAIGDVTAYSNTLNYLERLTLIDSVQLLTVSDDTCVFQVELLGDARRLRRAIAVGNVLVSEEDDGVSLSFRYAP